MKNRVVKSVHPMIAGRRLCALLVSVSMVSFLAGCGGSKSSGGGGGGGGGLTGGGGNSFTYGTWTWVDGSNVAGEDGVYGTLGTAAASNIPGARYVATSWADSSGNFWLFGGEGYDSVGTSGGEAFLNDLWKYNPSANEWTWVGGSDIAGQSGTYGTLGTASVGNIPGAREAPGTWTDSSGNVWLFGGAGYDSVGTEGRLNDLWKYSPSTGEWTWVGGSSVADPSGTYGTLGTAAAGNIPGGRNHPVTWTDASGNFWLFGGIGYDSQGTVNYLNDLWKFSPGTGEWTWVSGSNTGGQDGTYGTEGTAAAGNVPGSRNVAMGWIDGSGNLWLFGGVGYDSVGSGNGDVYLNDLWKYSPTSGEWTWVGGAKIGDALGTYGTEGTAATDNIPGARWGGSTWVDSSGDFWLFGGLAVEDESGDADDFNDLWKYSPTSDEWAWMGGSDTGGARATYGTLGTGAAANLPGGRERCVSWVDSSGNVWIFGGYGVDSKDEENALNDLWKFEP